MMVVANQSVGFRIDRRLTLKTSKFVPARYCRRNRAIILSFYRDGVALCVNSATVPFPH